MTLRLRITLQTGLAIFITTILGITASVIILNQELSSFVSEEDRRLAEQVAPLIIRYHELGLSWEEIGLNLGTGSNTENWMSSSRSNMMGMMMNNGQRSEMMGSMGMWMDSQRSVMMNWGHINDHRIVITDPEGIVRVDSDMSLIGKVLHLESKNIGEELKSGGSYLGSVFVGSMIDSELNNNQKDLIRNLVMGIALSSLFSLLLSAVFIWFNLLKILKPIADLTNAVNIGSSGNHELHVHETGPYELEILTRGFNKMNESIVNANRIRNDIFSNISHELKTPLSLIRGNLEAMVDGVYDLSLENVESILNEAKQLGVIINDMTFLSEMSSGITFDKNDKIDIKSLVSDIVSSFSVIAVKSNVQLVTKAPFPFCSVQGNYAKLKQAISNVVSNAIIHGGTQEKIEISGSIRTTNNNTHILELHVLDYGKGVHEKELELIFNRLYRADKSRSRAKGGHGLGLSISREIMRIHKGKITARNHPSAGLEVILELPLIKSKNNFYI